MQASAFHVGIAAGIKSKIFILPIAQSNSGARAVERSDAPSCWVRPLLRA
jgi:hypothetical protein